MFDGNTILILAPHTDDGELGCGGTISKLLNLGKDVYYMAFSTAEESVPKGFPQDQLKIEVREATAKLGIPESNLFIKNYAVRKLNYVRQEVLEDLIEIRDKIKPDVIFMPCSQDIHQDHQTIHNEGIRAFKHSTLLGYELIWNNLSFHTDLFITLESRDITNKIEALQCYKTQSHRNYMTPDFVSSLGRIRGVQVGVEFAESFEVIRWIIK